MKTIIGIHYSALSDSTAIPDWVQLTPAGTFNGDDGRGPYAVEDADVIIAASMKPGRKLPIDISHATDIKVVNGDPAPAVGWIVEMQARDSGIWGRVEWTDAGRAALQAREYGYISPAIESTSSKPYRVTRVLRASLVNDPNFIMQSLHKSQNRKDTPMDPEILAALGLQSDADSAAALAAVNALNTSSTTLQTSLNAVSKALGLGDAADGAALVASLNAKLTTAPTEGSKDATIAGLQEQVAALAMQLNTVVTTHGRGVAEAIVDKAIADKRLVPALREHYITRHMKEPAAVETELKAFPSINDGGFTSPPADTQGAAVDDADKRVIALMGVDPEAYAKTRNTLTKEFG